MFAIIAGFALIAALLLVLILLLTYAIYQSSRQRIGYIPLPARAVPAVVEALGVSGAATVYDLGCGDGRILAAALQGNPKARGVGIEFNPLVARLARWRLRRNHRARILHGDILRHDLSAATHLFAYLNDATMALLEPKLARELQPGARLVSCDFPLPNTKPTRTIKIGEPWQLAQTLYIYEYK